MLIGHRLGASDFAGAISYANRLMRLGGLLALLVGGGVALLAPHYVAFVSDICRGPAAGTSASGCLRFLVDQGRQHDIAGGVLNSVSRASKFAFAQSQWQPGLSVFPPVF